MSAAELPEKRGDWRDAKGVLEGYFPKGIRSEVLLRASRDGLNIRDHELLMRLQQEQDAALVEPGAPGAEEGQR